MWESPTIAEGLVAGGCQLMYVGKEASFISRWIKMVHLKNAQTVALIQGRNC